MHDIHSIHFITRYEQELAAIAQYDWIANDIDPCPCSFEEDQLPPAGWTVDSGCNFQEDSACQYHDGAHGCIRKTGDNRHGNQCCYTYNNGIYERVQQGVQAAGTADLEVPSLFFWRHTRADVWTFQDCCVDCDDADICALYIGGTGTNEAERMAVRGARSDPFDCDPLLN